MLRSARQWSCTLLGRLLPPYTLPNLFLVALSRCRSPNLSLMLPSRITVPVPSAPSQEDIFSSALSSLFTDDTQNSHGSPGELLIYTSPAFGGITLQIPTHPHVDEDRKLFAHYLWNASLIAADGIERASAGERHTVCHNDKGEAGRWNPRWWNVRGKRVLELGAGMSRYSTCNLYASVWRALN